MHSIENPPIPFNFPINGGLQTGSELIIQGATYNGQQKRFHIKLQGQGDDVVLHFNPRFKFFEDTIVLNSRTYAGWGTEERHRNRLNVGDSFRIRLVCHHSHFLVLVNEKEVCHYEHRLSPQMIRGMEITGDVMVNRVQMINFPQPQTQHSFVPPPNSFPSAPSMPMAPHYPSLGPVQNSYPPPPDYGFNSGPQQNHPSPHGRHCHDCGNRGCHHCRR